MPHSPALSGSDHPAPRRHKAPEIALAFALLAAPLAWALHLLVNYSVAGQNCVGAAPAVAVAFGPASAMSTIFIVDLVAIAIAACGGYVALKLWKKTKDEKGGDTQKLVHAGEGRTRFMAMCGMLTSVLFGVAVAADAIGSIVGPPC